MSTSNNSPQNFLGGTWVRIEGKFLLGAGSGYGAGSTGGEATHKLTTDEIPKHNHDITYTSYTSQYTNTRFMLCTSASTAPIKAISRSYNQSQSMAKITDAFIEYTGSSLAHNNMPPYYVVYIRRRTA